MKMTQSNSKPTALHLREMIVQTFDYIRFDFAEPEQQKLRRAVVALTFKYFPVQSNQKGEKKHAKKQTR